MITNFTLVIQQTAIFMLLTHLAANVAIMSHLIATFDLSIELLTTTFALLTQETTISDQLRHLIATYTLLGHISSIFALLIHQITTSAL